MDFKNINKDKLINKGKDITDAAYQKSLEMIERTKLRFKIQESKAKAKQAYTELGKLTYELLKSGEIKSDSRMLTIESEIDSANYHTQLLMRELCEIKGAKICSKCGSLNSEKAKFCSECANPLNDKE